MTKATSPSPLQSQAEASIDAVAAEIQRSARQELDELRSLIGTRLVALERALDRNPNDPAFDPIIQKLCKVAAEQADAASTSARARSEEAAARVLASARKQAQTELDAARKQSEAAQAQSKSIREDLERRLALAEAAAAETASEMADLRAQSDTGRERIRTLEQEMAEMTLARDVAEAQLEGEAQTRTALATELDAVREMALYAQTDADTSRLSLRNATDRIRVLEERYRKLDAEQPRRSPGATTGEAGTLLDQVRAGLQTLTATTTGRGLLDALLEPLAQHFAMVAWCVVGPEDCVVWGSRGFDPPLPSRKTGIPLRADSALARALADWKPATERASDGQTPIGLSGRPVGYAIAWPIVPQGQGAVMLYAENPPELAPGDPDVATKIADILADHVQRRLRKKQTAKAGEASAHTPARQARRVKIKKDINVTVDGAPSALVDLSTQGAQVLSSRAVRPNHSVQLTLPNGNGGLSCEARVVWVVVEHSQDQKNALYRAGMQFRGVDAPELDAIVSQHGLFEPAIKH
jgi:hypothetical protein